MSISPTSVTLDAGQSQLFNATPSGGSGNYTSYQWYVNGTLQNEQTASTFNYSPASAGTYLITATVTDNSSTTSAQSNTATITMNAASTSPTPTPTPTVSPTPTPTPTVSPTPTPTLSPAGTAAFVFSPLDWAIVVVVIAIIALLLLFLLLFRRGRKLTVTAQDAETLSPISGATVSVSGPKSLAGTTGSKGEAVFSNVKKGDYSIIASATGYNPSVPAAVSVKNNTNYVIKLNSTAPKTQET